MPDGRPFSASAFSVRFPPDALVNVAHQQATQSLSFSRSGHSASSALKDLNTN
jgi:hypothetical protein